MPSLVPFHDWLLKEWLFFLSLAGVGATSLYLGRLPALGMEDVEILFLLFSLFLTVKGLERSGALLWVSRRMERGPFLAFKLVTLAFFFSMAVTNDAALVVLVPITLALQVEKKGFLVILEALAANAGSALTPFGNPQNLFISWTFHVPPGEFIRAVAPFSLFFLLVLGAVSWWVRVEGKGAGAGTPLRVAPSAFLYGVFLVLVVLGVVRVLPVHVGWVVVLYVLLFDRPVLGVDYALLGTLLCFFGISGNLKCLLSGSLAETGHVFLMTALSSQVLSNVPAAVLLGKFTLHWKALLWGASVGGFGGLLGSLANLIAYKLYLSTPGGKRDRAAFTAWFFLFTYLAFFLGMGLYFLLEKRL